MFELFRSEHVPERYSDRNEGQGTEADTGNAAEPLF